MQATQCSKCHIQYYVPSSFIASRLADHGTFNDCPNGHKQHFPQETETERLRKEIVDLRRQLWEQTDKAERNFNLAHALGKI